MASSVLIASLFSPSLFIFIIFFFSLSSADQSLIREACKAARDPPTCEKWLSKSATQNATALDVVESMLSLTSDNLRKGRETVQAVLRSSRGDPKRTSAAKKCLNELNSAEYRLDMVGAALAGGRIKDGRAWMSASLVHKYDCWSALKHANDGSSSSLVRATMAFFNNTLIAGSSDALAMIANYDFFGDETGQWGPVRTERDGFWGPVGRGPGFSTGGVPRGLKPNATVCKNGGCDHATVQEAIDRAPSRIGPGERYVIHVRAGVYEETVRVSTKKTNVVLLGAGMGKTVITGSMSASPPVVSTYSTATFGVSGDGFMASNLTIQNTAGEDAHQAVAFRSDSDRSIIESCEFIGNQDTLYAHSMRQYYKSCRIQGSVDFIFGFSASFFQDCTILVAPRLANPENGETNTVTAHGRIDPAQSTGFVFQNCLVNGTEAYMQLYYSKPNVHWNFLGRPWKEYSRTVFINSTFEALISPDGWFPWDKDFALPTLYYGEHGNKGKGADTSKRVAWSNQIPAEHVGAYSIQNFIQGDQWIPSLV